jgi:hypothetical protein
MLPELHNVASSSPYWLTCVANVIFIFKILFFGVAVVARVPQFDKHEQHKFMSKYRQ